MEEFLSAFHFLRPWWLLAAAVPLAGCFRFFAGMKNVSAWESVCDRKLLDFLLVRGSSRQRSLTAGLLLAGMLGAIVALAGPSWQKREIPVFAPENPVMFLLNLSSDMDETDVTPNRLARAKYAVSDLLKMLSGAESGLVVYTNEPFLISPLSEDGRVIDNLLRAVTPDIVPENGDRLDRALDYAVKRLRESGRDKGNIVVLAADVGQDFNLAMISAAGAYAKGYRVSVVDVAAAGSEKLKMIAEKGGGAYVSVISGLPRLSSWLVQNGGRKLTESENEKEIWEDAGYYLLIVPLFCALYFFRRGILSVVLLLAFAGSAEAGFFLNDDQEGMRAFERQEFERAAASFRDPAWKASSYYRAGNFEEALKHFAGSDAESLYNRGNALAKSGKIEEAIKSYEKVLETAPEHEDARFNLEYLKKQQQQQQQQSSGGGQDQDKREQQSSAGNNGGQNGNNAASGEQPDGGDKEQNRQPQQSSASGGSGEEEAGSENKQPQSSDGNEQNGGSENERRQTAPQPEERSAPTEAEAKAAAAGEEKDDRDGEGYSEAAQAREQQFRDIPEDAGGLLRAFILKEYQKNRYKDN